MNGPFCQAVLAGDLHHGGHAGPGASGRGSWGCWAGRAEAGLPRLPGSESPFASCQGSHLAQDNPALTWGGLAGGDPADRQGLGLAVPMFHVPALCQPLARPPGTPVWVPEPFLSSVYISHSAISAPCVAAPLSSPGPVLASQ